MESPSAGGLKENSFKELVDALKSHFEPKPLVIALKPGTRQIHC